MAVVNGVAGLQPILDDIRSRFPSGAVIGLTGELGAGKTTLVREFVRHVLGDSNLRVASPTFVLHQSYRGALPIEHFDLYRFEEASSRDLLEIGYYEAVERAREGSGYVFVEWPERAQTRDLGLRARIEITVLGPDSREISLKSVVPV